MPSKLTTRMPLGTYIKEHDPNLLDTVHNHPAFAPSTHGPTRDQILDWVKTAVFETLSNLIPQPNRLPDYGSVAQQLIEVRLRDIAVQCPIGIFNYEIKTHIHPGADGGGRLDIEIIVTIGLMQTLFEVHVDGLGGTHPLIDMTPLPAIQTPPPPPVIPVSLPADLCLPVELDPNEPGEDEGWDLWPIGPPSGDEDG